MRLFTKKTGLVVCLIGATAAALTLTSTSASASSSAPRNGDVVGVGSDTLQNGLNFMLDGSPGSPGGYNNGGNNHRVYSFDATGDANGRATYDGTCGAINTTTTGLGTFCDTTNDQDAEPAARLDDPAGRHRSGDHTERLWSRRGRADRRRQQHTGYQGLPNGSIQFARMSRLPNSSEEAPPAARRRARAVACTSTRSPWTT